MANFNCFCIFFLDINVCEVLVYSRKLHRFKIKCYVNKQNKKIKINNKLYFIFIYFLIIQKQIIIHSFLATIFHKR